MPTAHTTYLSGSTGRWRIDSITPVAGAGLPDAARIDIIEGHHPRRVGCPGAPAGGSGTSAVHPQCTRAALIPLSKSSSWWSLAQDERRSLPAVKKSR